MSVLRRYREGVDLRPGMETVILWLAVAVVVPSLLLSLLGFWTLHRQEQLAQQAARHRTTVLLSEAEAQLQTRLGVLKAGFSAWAEEEAVPASAPAIEDFRSQEILLESLFLLDSGGNVLLPPPPPVPLPMERPDSPAWETAQRYEFSFGNLTQAVGVYRDIARVDEKSAFHALNAMARCAAKQGDFETAQLTYARLLNEVISIPTPLRLGMSCQLAQLQQRVGQLEAAARTALESAEWMADTSRSNDYQTCVYYLEQMRHLWETIPPAAIPDALQKRWANAQERWQKRFADYLSHDTLNNILLPVLWPSVAAPQADATQYIPVHAPHGWQVTLVTCLKRGGYLGSVVCVASLREGLIPPLNDRLRQLGEGTEGTLVVSSGSHSERPLAVLRLAHPLNFWQLAVSPTEDASSPAVRWQSHLIRWSVVLCLGAILGGVCWTCKRLQQERELSQLKTDFVSNVSHELKTPLTSIRMFVEMLRLRRYRDASEEEECLDILHQEIGRLTRLVDRVLDFSRMERGRQQFEFADGDLPVVVRETAEVFQRQMGEDEDGCEIQVQIAEGIPRFPFDRDAIAEVLWNLVHNAVKYSHPPKQVRVKLEQANRMVILSVQDNGIGIPKREQKRIFERFYRVDDRLTREVEGSGLGLAMVAYMVQAHGGTVSVDSQVGRGSTFVVNLPMRRDARGTDSDRGG